MTKREKSPLFRDIIIYIKFTEKGVINFSIIEDMG